MATITRSPNSAACATPSPTGHGTAMPSIRWSSWVFRKTPSRGDWRSSDLRTAIRIIRRSRRGSMPTTAGRSIATWWRRCRKERYARHDRGAWMTAASSRRSRLRKRLDHHYEDDEERNHQADDPVGRRLSVESLVVGARDTFGVHHLDLLPDDARVKADGHHDQEHEEDQAGHDPAAKAPLAGGQEHEPGDQKQPIGRIGDAAVDERDPFQGERRMRWLARSQRFPDSIGDVAADRGDCEEDVQVFQ